MVSYNTQIHIALITHRTITSQTTTSQTITAQTTTALIIQCLTTTFKTDSTQTTVFSFSSIIFTPHFKPTSTSFLFTNYLTTTKPLSKPIANLTELTLFISLLRVALYWLPTNKTNRVFIVKISLLNRQSNSYPNWHKAK